MQERKHKMSNKIKRLLSAIIAVVMVMTSVNMVFAADSQLATGTATENLPAGTYKFNKSGIITNNSGTESNKYFTYSAKQFSNSGLGIYGTEQYLKFTSAVSDTLVITFDSGSLYFSKDDNATKDVITSPYSTTVNENDVCVISGYSNSTVSINKVSLADEDSSDDTSNDTQSTDISGSVELVKTAKALDIHNKFKNIDNEQTGHDDNNVAISNQKFYTDSAPNGVAQLLDDNQNVIAETNIVKGAYTFKDVANGTYSVNAVVNGSTAGITSVASGTKAKKITVKEQLYEVKFTTNIKDYKKDNMPVVKYKGVAVLTLPDKTYLDSNRKVIRKASTTHYAMLPAGDYTIEFSTPDTATFSLQLDGGAAPEFTVSANDQEIPLQFVAKTISDNMESAYTAFKQNNESGYIGTGDTALVNQTTAAKGFQTSEGVQNSANGVELPSTDDYILFKLNKTSIVYLSTANIACILYTENGKINGNTQYATVDSGYSTLPLILSEGSYIIFTKTTGEKNANVKNITVSDSSVFNVKYAKQLDNETIVTGVFNNTGNGNGTAVVEDYEQFAILIAANKTALNYENLVNFCTGKATDNTITGTDTTDETIYYYMPNDISEKVIVDKIDCVYTQVVTDGYADNQTINAKNDDELYYSTIAYGGEQTTYYAKGATKIGNTWLIQDEAFEFTIGGEN